MNAMNKSLITWICLLFAAPSFAADRASAKASGAPSIRTATKAQEAARYAGRCQSRAPSRDVWPQGTLLWGTKPAWTTPPENDEQSSVLVSVDLGSPLKANAAVKSLQLKNGHLVASPNASASLEGTVLQGTSSDGKPVEITVCEAEPSPDDPELSWYHIEAWNPVAQQWENPCMATGQVPEPRAVAVRGTWDRTGAHHDAPGKITLACETGVISKCIGWGYKPWAQREGASLADLHQACTRMARADYCGNGRSHTQTGTVIDMYDQLGVQQPTTESSPKWDPASASFEAAWTTDGAACLSHTRDGRALETILQECPGRFQADSAAKLSPSDHCKVQRPEVNPQAAPLRNRSYGAPPGGVGPMARK